MSSSRLSPAGSWILMFLSEYATTFSMCSSFQITGPENKVIYEGEKETDGRYTFTAPLTGEYSFCFSNAMSTVTSKQVPCCTAVISHLRFNLSSTLETQPKTL